jgi:hypothetical protein
VVDNDVAELLSVTEYRCELIIPGRVAVLEQKRDEVETFCKVVLRARDT